MKRTAALLLAIAIALSITACAKGGANGGKTATANGKVLEDNATLKITVTSDINWPYDNNWKVWNYIREKIGGKLEISPIPATDIFTKFPLMMATPDDLPDLISFQNMPTSMSGFASQGAFVALDDNVDKMPNYKAFWDSVSDVERSQLDTRRFSDGKIYYTPIYGMERQTNVRAWLYREDAFRKNGIEVPETMDELYEACKKLKSIYPDSYPCSMRSGFSNIDVIGSSWKPYFNTGAYYDFDNEKWCYGAAEDTMKEIVEFLRKMHSEGLLPPNFVTLKSTEWQKLITTNRGFIMPEYHTRIDFFNPIVHADNPDFKMTAMVPPKANNTTGSNMVNKFNWDPTGYGICNTGNAESIDNALKYIDWFYSDEGAEITSWGREGETYEVKDDGKHYIITDPESTPKYLYGFLTIGAYLRVDPVVADAIMTDESRDTTDMVLEHTMPNINPALWLTFNDEEDAKKADYETSIKTYVEETITKFLIGQKPMSEWDAFEAELAKLPVSDLLKVYETAYNRTLGK